MEPPELKTISIRTLRRRAARPADREFGLNPRQIESEALAEHGRHPRVDPNPGVDDTHRMRTVELSEAEGHLTELVESASHGEVIIVASGGEPRAKIVGLVSEDKRLRQPGKGKGRFTVLPGFDDPLPEDILQLFESGDSE